MTGDFAKINESRSLPVSELLFKTLIAQLAEETFPNGTHNQVFSFNPRGIRDLPEHPDLKRKHLDFAPFYSIERDLWISYSFTEEKAHRIAFFTANQSKEFIAIYCNPTYSRHHRCNYGNTTVLSLFEFAEMISAEVRMKYEPQIRFLQNHLIPEQSRNSRELLIEIMSPTRDLYEIQKSDLMEALAIMKILPSDELDFFHSLAAANLINAYLGRVRKRKHDTSKMKNLFRDMYSFKIYVSEIVTARIKEQNFSNPIYIKDDLIIIEAMGLQFSFHNILKNETLRGFELSDHNKVIIWSQKRLQPLAPLILRYSRALRRERMS
jgi:hypothetical protein